MKEMEARLHPEIRAWIKREEKRKKKKRKK
jgi:hypothetical protein